MQKLLLSLLIFPLLAGCNQHQHGTVVVRAIPQEANLPSPPKNIILMIGDGMGLSQVSAALYSNNNQLNLEQFLIIGLQKTFSSDNLITDSAAGASAMACGVKTYNGAIGVNRDTIAVSNILEEAEQHGLATGVITTSTIVHATPAGFLAHQPERKMYEEIAVDLVNSDADLLIGGGKRFFDQRTRDNRDLYRELEDKGYLVSDYFQTEFNELVYTADKNLVYFTANEDPIPFSQGRDYLVPAVQMAPEFLQSRSKKGFFLMIESAQIDWGGHANDLDYLVQETLEFDRAVGEILEFAREDGETLVIVTGDHETGGLSLNLGSQMNKVLGSFTTEYHTGVLIPVYAFGPGAELFGGIYDNTEIYHKMKQAFQFSQNGKVMGKAPTSALGIR